MEPELLLALWRVRWEAPTDDDFARSVAEVLGSCCAAKAIEISIAPPHAMRVQLGAEPPEVRSVAARAVVEADATRRPRAGWGGDRPDPIGAEVGASLRITVPLRCRHTDAYLVLWTARVAAASELAGAIAVALGVVVDARVLLQRLAKLSRTAHSDNRRLRQSLRERLDVDETTHSPAMRRCLQRAHAVAPYDTPVLVTGPSGAGKELLSRGLHARSPRASGPFVKLNCGAIPEALAESELFGHRRGAFTGATADHRGVFDRATGGTLLLDEVGELSPSVQVKLLRVLQEGTFTPVGGEQERHADVRVIAATHRDLAARVREGSFREDLFYRLAVFEVRVPGLSERPEDLPMLVRGILGRIAARLGRSVPVVPRQVMGKLAAHDWPGNVRELENTLEGALIMSKGDRLELPLVLAARTTISRDAGAVEPLDHAVRRAIEAALRQCRGKIYGEGGAAQRLGLKPGTLQSKMRKLGIDRGDFIGASAS